MLVSTYQKLHYCLQSNSSQTTGKYLVHTGGLGKCDGNVLIFKQTLLNILIIKRISHLYNIITYSDPLKIDLSNDHIITSDNILLLYKVDRPIGRWTGRSHRGYAPSVEEKQEVERETDEKNRSVHKKYDRERERQQ